MNECRHIIYLKQNEMNAHKVCFTLTYTIILYKRKEDEHDRKHFVF